jgi:hypothetical protein
MDWDKYDTTFVEILQTTLRPFGLGPIATDQTLLFTDIVHCFAPIKLEE